MYLLVWGEEEERARFQYTSVIGIAWAGHNCFAPFSVACAWLGVQLKWPRGGVASVVARFAWQRR